MQLESREALGNPSIVELQTFVHAAPNQLPRNPKSDFLDSPLDGVIKANSIGSLWKPWACQSRRRLLSNRPVEQCDMPK
jgi:hypothetical protein